MLAVVLVILGLPISGNTEGKRLNLTFCCNANNDLYRVVVGSGCRCERCDSAAEAVERAGEGTGVLILADGYPEALTNLDTAVFDRAAVKKLRLYVEYPAFLPGLNVGEQRRTVWERVVIASDALGEGLPKLGIMSVSDCRFVPVKAAEPMMVVARVAGFDTAIYGIPESASPILFEMTDRDVIVATTKLSGFVTGRYAPAKEWGTVWERILGMLDPHNRIALKWTPTVHPAYQPDEKLPADAERRAFKDGAEWYLNSRLLVSAGDWDKIKDILLSGEETRLTPGPDAAVGDGSLGILEGYAAGIRWDGSQIQRVPLRADCNAEVAMALAVDWSVNESKRSRDVAGNLLDYVYVKSGMCGGKRGDPKNPAYGLIAWGAIAPGWEIANYGDDNARAMLATMVASACLGTDKWDEPLMRALLANLRTTGSLGFRGNRIDVAQLEQRGWKAYYNDPTINRAPHYESYLWACNLWAYRATGYKPFLEKARMGIRITMEGFPDKWLWNDTIERARMLLCLSWLVRVDDTPEHRGWLKTIADDLLAHQQSCGALPEIFGGTGGGYTIPASNEAYGTTETPLIQKNGDPATDQLYTAGFALLGLHEAAAATGEPKLKEAEDKLARYLCRIQVRSKEHPNLNGTWFRAFDYRRWDYWASSADAGWGAWSAETGWGPAWITAVLGLRAKGVSVWDLTSGSRVASKFRDVEKAGLSLE